MSLRPAGGLHDAPKAPNRLHAVLAAGFVDRNVDTDSINFSDLSIGAKTVPMKKPSKKSQRPFKGSLKVGDYFPLEGGLPNQMTLAGVKFFLTSDPVLEDELSRLMEGSKAIPEFDGAQVLHVYLSNDLIQQTYNTLVVLATKVGRDKNMMMFSISLAQTYRYDSGVDELNTEVDGWTVDFLGNKEELLENKEILTKEMQRNDALLKSIPVVVRAEVVLSDAELAFLNEPEPIDPSIKKRRPPPRKRPGAAPTPPPQTPPNNKTPGALPPSYTTPVHELDSESDGENAGRPAAQPPPKANVHEMSDDDDI